MIAMEYMDMMSRMTMTVSATQPRFFTISVMVNASFRLLSPCGWAACWNRKTKKPKALLPRMLIRMVTVKILQRFSFVMARALPPGRRARAAQARRPLRRAALARRCPRPVLLKHEVVRDDAGDLDGLPRQERRREARLARGRHSRLLQERVAADRGRRDDAPRLVNENLHGDSPLRARRLRNRRVGGLRLRDGLAVQDAAPHDRLLRLRRRLRPRRRRRLFAARNDGARPAGARPGSRHDA